MNSSPGEKKQPGGGGEEEYTFHISYPVSFIWETIFTDNSRIIELHNVMSCLGDHYEKRHHLRINFQRKLI